MSYVVEVIRPIRKEEVVDLIPNDSELSIVAEGENWLDVLWSRGREQAVFHFAQGRLTATTPNEAAWTKIQSLAQRLGAAVIGEEDDLPNRPALKPGVFAGRSTWIGWPLLVFLLGAMLAWKW